MCAFVIQKEWGSGVGCNMENKEDDDNDDEERKVESLDAAATTADMETNNDDKSKMNDNKDTQPSMIIPPVNLWSSSVYNNNIDAIMTEYLSKTPNLPVFYRHDDAKRIDTWKILLSSGKGCDASNLYEEEVIVVHCKHTTDDEVYYSDDEQERLAKQQRQQEGTGNC